MGANYSKLLLQPTLQSKRQSMSDLHHSVFENDLLLKKILTLALQNFEADLRPIEACALRQVSRRWNLTVSSIFLQAREPLLHLSASYDHSKDLQNLIKGFESSTLYSDLSGGECLHLPPFSLSLNGTLIDTDWDHVTFFEKLIVHLSGASSLLHLHIRDTFFLNPEEHYMVPWLPSHLHLSVLQNLTLECDAGAHRHHLFDAFIQRILDQSPELQEIISEEKSWDLEGHTSPLILPLTLTDLRILTNNRKLSPILNPLQPSFPQLSTLVLGSLSPDRLEYFYSILSDIRLSLKHLILGNREESDDRWLHLELIKFPVLPKLKTLMFLECVSLAQLPNPDHDIGAHFPALEKLVMSLYPFQRPSSVMLLRGWCAAAQSPCPSVRTLFLQLADCRVDQFYRTWTWRPISLETMFRIRSHFPCVTHLGVVINWSSLGGLRTLFRAMGGQLKSLMVEVKRSSESEVRVVYDRDHWDGLLLGKTPEVVRLLRRRWWQRRRRDSWTEVVDSERASIRNLGNLEELSISGLPCPESDLRSGMVSELTFRLAFLEMPALKQLTFGEHFGVTSKCVRLWRKSGGGRTFEVDVDEW